MPDKNTRYSMDIQDDSILNISVYGQVKAYFDLDLRPISFNEATVLSTLLLEIPITLC